MTKKRFPSIYSLLLVASSLVMACNATTSPTTGTTTPGSMVATVNGKAWSSTVVPGVTGGATATKNSGVVTVTGVATDLTEITLVLRNPGIRTDSFGLSTTALGEYSQGIPDTSTAYLTIPSLSNIYPGSVTITAYDTTKKQISGQFHFVGRKSHNLSDTVLITSGSFLNVSWN